MLQDTDTDETTASRQRQQSNRTAEKIYELEEDLIGKQSVIETLIEENEQLKARLHLGVDYFWCILCFCMFIDGASSLLQTTFT